MMTKSRSVFGFQTGLAFLLAIGTAPALFAQDAQNYIVQFRAGVTAAARRAAVGNAGASARVVYNGVSAASVRVPNDHALRALQARADVVAVVPDRVVFADQSANAKAAGKPGGGGGTTQVVPAGVVRVGVPRAGSDGSGVGVAILDTGVDLTHADLAGTIDAYSAFGPSCMDDEGHGTHVAGIVAARDNTRDVIGVAPAAQLYCVKVLDSTGSGSDESLMAGLDWVLINHDLVTPAIRVINMSLGRPGTVDDNPAMRDLFAALDAAGVLVVASAGNDPAADAGNQIPAAYPQVAAVASTTASTPWPSVQVRTSSPRFCSPGRINFSAPIASEKAFRGAARSTAMTRTPFARSKAVTIKPTNPCPITSTRSPSFGSSWRR